MAGHIHCLASFRILYPVCLKTKVAKKKLMTTKKQIDFNVFTTFVLKKMLISGHCFSLLLSLDIQALKGT
jgi:hypothetical protein